MNKEINFILEEKDFKKDSGVSKDTFTNLVESFKNYLKIIDNTELVDKDNKGNDWTIDSLLKHEKKQIKLCKDIISGEVSMVDDKGNFTTMASTEKIIMNLINKVKSIVLIRKKIDELNKKSKEKEE